MMKNNCNSKRFVLLALVLLLALSSLATSAHAIRLLSEDGGAEGNYGSMYVRARSTMAHLFERLASGPSKGGGGH
ncbi:PAMP-induced secreted peptide 1 [Bienertia sinuspersici]